MASISAANFHTPRILFPNSLSHDANQKKICQSQCRTFPLLRRSAICRASPQGVKRETSNTRIFASVTDLLLDETEEKFRLPKGDTWSVQIWWYLVGSSERIKNVADIIVKDNSERKLVVVSAMSKVTDMIDDSFVSALDVLEKHRSTAFDLLDGDDLSSFLSRLHNDISNLKAMLPGHATESFKDFVVGHGELWSAQILSSVVRKKGMDSKWMDTKRIDPDYLESEKRLEKWYHQNPSKIIIATVSEAVILQTLSYQEAWGNVIFGANVLHPRTIIPVMRYNIPIKIRNIFNLSAPGTKICHPMVNEEDGQNGESLVKGFATIDNLALNWNGWCSRYSSCYFGAVKDVGANVIMISQASSEHSVCFAVPEKEVKAVAEALKSRFHQALDSGRLSQIAVIPNCSILAAVGQKMASTPGVSASLFNALAKANINVRAIAQGCSEYNITVVIKQEDFIGAGLIGHTLLGQLRDQAAVLKEKFNIDLRVMGITSSSTMLLSDVGIDLSRWRDLQIENGEVANLEKFVQHVHGNHLLPNTVLVDCTADSGVASHYDWLQKGIHVITPNKKANSGPLDQYLKLRSLQRQSYTHYFYEATVGAGLPIISTLRGLLETGDKILKIEGIFSGTLTFSEVVAEAKQAGYTEPDPRDDLSGTDVARKVIILARESGLKLELSDIPIDNLVPEPLRDSASPEEFMQQLPQFDQDMTKNRQDAEDAGEVLRFVGIVDVANKKGVVELRRYKKDHPFAQLSGSDNIIAFTTTRYKNQPLIVRGPVILRLASYLGAPS
ncbi:hypothetical protein I3843_Q014400 [Carya illinoinensis]|nr:hypothetical protein I3843_Q014400 [Carya illinoinensis]